MSNFKPKGADVLRKEVEQVFIDDGLDLEVNKDLIDKVTSIREKDEQFKASVHDSKEKKKLTIAEQEKKIKELEEAKSKGTQTPNGDEQEAKTRQMIAEEMFINSGGSNTELRQIKKVMTATGKSFRDAQNDSLFVAFKEKQEREGISRSSQLPPSRGGSPKLKGDEDTIANKNMGNLPPGFSAKDSNK